MTSRSLSFAAGTLLAVCAIPAPTASAEDSAASWTCDPKAGTLVIRYTPDLAQAKWPKAPAPVHFMDLLKLDKAQQARTQQLVEELYERNAKIREKWDRGGKVHPEELLASRGIFEKDFQAILTEDQRRVYADERLKLQMKSSRPHGS